MKELLHRAQAKHAFINQPPLVYHLHWQKYYLHKKNRKDKFEKAHVLDEKIRTKKQTGISAEEVEKGTRARETSGREVKIVSLAIESFYLHGLAQVDVCQEG